MTFTLKPGERFYAGYHEFAVHPDEAAVLLDRGYAIVDGMRFPVRKMDMIGDYPLIRIIGLPDDPSDPQCRGLHEGLMRRRMELDRGELREAA